MAFVIEPVPISTLFGRCERSWFAIYERIAPETDEMDTLILVARRFEVYESPVEKWKYVVNEGLHRIIES